MHHVFLDATIYYDYDRKRNVIYRLHQKKYLLFCYFSFILMSKEVLRLNLLYSRYYFHYLFYLISFLCFWDDHYYNCFFLLLLFFFYYSSRNLDNYAIKLHFSAPNPISDVQTKKFVWFYSRICNMKQRMVI